MYFVQLYGLHVFCALVDLGASGSPGVRPTPGLTSITQVVCVSGIVPKDCVFILPG